MPEVNEFGQYVGDPVPSWTPRSRPGPVTLEGQYVVLEPLGQVHLAALHSAACGPQDRPLWTYLPREPPADVDALAELVASTFTPPDLLTFALVPRGAGPSGMASYLRIDPAAGSIEVGWILLARTLQRTRAATEAIHLLMRHAFEDLGYRRFEWKCDSLNEPSRHAAERLGFTYEGRFRQHLVVKGRNRDTDWFSVTAAEWPAVRAEHARWLDPANFDEDGQQRSRLRVTR